MATEINELRGKFLGIHQQHSYNLYHLLDKVIRQKKPMRFIEIGTGAGAMSCFLGMYAWQRGTHLLTLDITEKRLQTRMTKPFFELLKVQYEVMDCFSDEAVSLIKAHIGSQPTLMFCDGGNKAKEFDFFKDMMPRNRGTKHSPKSLKHKSVIVTHDYPNECSPHQIHTDGWESEYESRWDDTKSMVWVKSDYVEGACSP